MQEHFKQAESARSARGEAIKSTILSKLGEEQSCFHIQIDI